MGADWIKHDHDASEDPKILALISKRGKVAYADFWLIAELLLSQDDYQLPVGLIPALQQKLNYKMDEVEALIDDLVSLGLAVKTDTHFFFPSILKRTQALEEKRAKGRNRVNTHRANKDQDVTHEKQDVTDENQNVTNSESVTCALHARYPSLSNSYSRSNNKNNSAPVFDGETLKLSAEDFESLKMTHGSFFTSDEKITLEARKADANLSAFEQKRALRNARKYMESWAFKADEFAARSPPAPQDAAGDLQKKIRKVLDDEA